MAKGTRRTSASSEHPNAKGVEDRAAASENQAEEVNRRTSGMEATPTPTQRENDLAKVGALHPDDKEEDGSGPALVQRRVLIPEGSEATYRTKAEE